MSEPMLDAAGRRRSPATMPAFHAGRAPRNKGIRYPADPQTIEEIVAVMRRAGDGVHGRRLRGLIVVLWRAGLRIQEALALTEADLDPRRARCWCGAARAAAAARSASTTGPANSSRPGSTCALSCRSGRCSASSTAPRADAPGRPPPRAPSSAASPARPAYGGGSLRDHPHIQHTNLGITSIYLEGIDSAEIIDTVHARRAPMVPVQSSLQV